MKFYIIFLLLIVSICVYGKDYTFEYKSMPKSIDCEFNLYMNNQKNGVKYLRTNTIKINTINKKEENNYILYDTKIKKTYSEEDENIVDCTFKLENIKNSIKCEKISDIPIYDYANMNENLFVGQLIFPDKNLKVGDNWDVEILNPIGEKLKITNRLIRVADNVATIYFTGKSPFRGFNIKTENELMKNKLDIGSTFYLMLDSLSGHAEINCSGIWNFDVETGHILKSDQYYKINSLMRKDDKKEIVGISDFIYADVFISLNYDYKY